MECMLCKRELKPNEYEICETCKIKYRIEDEEPRVQKIRRRKRRDDYDVLEDY